MECYDRDFLRHNMLPMLLELDAQDKLPALIFSSRSASVPLSVSVIVSVCVFVQSRVLHAACAGDPGDAGRDGAAEAG